MNKKLKIILLSVVFATAGYAQDTHTGLNKLEMQKVFTSSDVKTMKLDKKEQVDTQGKRWIYVGVFGWHYWVPDNYPLIYFR